jgi:hypothetical protein
MYADQINPILMKFIKENRRFSVFPLDEHFPEQFPPTVLPLQVARIPFLDRGGECIPWKPALHKLFCLSLGKRAHQFVYSVLLCMRCGLPVLPEELVFMILELSYAPKLLLVPVMRAVWDEVDLFAFMRTVSKRGGVRYPGYFPKYIYEK